MKHSARFGRLRWDFSIECGCCWRGANKPAVASAPTFAMFALDSGGMPGLWSQQHVEPTANLMGGGFMPFRRDVQWAKATEAAITPLLETLEFTAGKRNWGYQLRFGLFEISQRDLDVIAVAMKLQGNL